MTPPSPTGNPFPPGTPGNPDPPQPAATGIGVRLRATWARVQNSKLFVAFSTSMGTAIYAQVQSYLTTGIFNESPQYWEKTALGAALVAAASVYHLSLTPKNVVATSNQ